MKLDARKFNEAAAALDEFDRRRAKAAELFESTPRVLLVFSLDRMPAEKGSKPHQIELPHPFRAETDSICLIVHDEKKKEMKARMRKGELPHVERVVSIGDLRTKHESFERRRVLANAHAVFACDRAVYAAALPFLGSTFRKRAKNPAAMRTTGDVAAKLEALFRSVLVPPVRGATVTVPIGTLAMKRALLRANARVALKLLPAALAGGDKNVTGVHVKLDDSPALPILLRFARSAPAPAAPAAKDAVRALVAECMDAVERETTAPAPKKAPQ